MSTPSPRSSGFARLAHAAAVTCVLGAAGLAAPVAALAEPPPAHAHHVRNTWNEEKRETVEERIASLHQDLRISPTEEANWSAVAQTMRDNDDRMRRMRADGDDHQSAVERLRTYARFTQSHADGLKTLIAAFETLYQGMPDDQKQRADAVFRRFGHHGDSQS